MNAKNSSISNFFRLCDEFRSLTIIKATLKTRRSIFWMENNLAVAFLEKWTFPGFACLMKRNRIKSLVTWYWYCLPNYRNVKRSLSTESIRSSLPLTSAHESGAETRKINMMLIWRFQFSAFFPIHKTFRQIFPFCRLILGIFCENMFWKPTAKDFSLFSWRGHSKRWKIISLFSAKCFIFERILKQRMGTWEATCSVLWNNFFGYFPAEIN